MDASSPLLREAGKTGLADAVLADCLAYERKLWCGGAVGRTPGFLKGWGRREPDRCLAPPSTSSERGWVSEGQPPPKFD